MLKFRQKEVTTKDLWTKTDIFMTDINKMVVSDKVLCNNGKDCRYIVGYQADETLMPLFIKIRRDIFSVTIR